jgi:transglutaminase-like putative cysteine protease
MRQGVEMKMKTISRFFAAAILILAGAAALRAVKEPEPAPVRTFAFSYEVSLKDVPPDAGSARIWIPEAVSGPGQTVEVESVDSAVRSTETRDPEYGNHIFYTEVAKKDLSRARFVIHYLVTRREYTGQPEVVASGDGGAMDRFLRADRLVPIDGRIKEMADEITRGKSGPKEKARAIYDYVFRTLRYDKTGTGWGRGDTVWVCDSKRGNCTDFHSLFIALMRAEKIPARFEIGFPLPKTTEGEIPGYHCWAEFHVDGEGWIPVDISEAWKAPALQNFFFGHLDANRVQFTIGRDLTLSPRQAGEPLNYFIYPYAEVDGKPSAVATKFSFRDMKGGNS